MRKIDNRQYKLMQIKPMLARRASIGVGGPVSTKLKIKAKKGRRYDSKLDRRGMSS